MQNGFEKHGIDHSSASSINMFSNAPCAWVAKYLFNHKLSFGMAARAGTLAEEAVVNVIANGWTEESAIDAAVKAYNKASSLVATDADIKRGKAIPGMISAALEELSQYGEPEFDGGVTGKQQKKIEIACNGDGWRLPLIGYLDFHFPKHGIVVDLKTTSRMPSVMSDEHTRQGALYRAAMGNQAVKFLYVTGKKASWFDIPDPAPILAEIKTILNRQERLLRHDAETIRDMVPVISGSFYWSGDSDLRKSIYGI